MLLRSSAMKKSVFYRIRNFSIKQKVVIGVIVIFVMGVAVTNVLIFSRMGKLVEDLYVDQARAICVMGEAIREYQADNWGRGIYDKKTLEKDVQGKFLYTVPVFSSILTMQKKAAELGYVFRVPKIQPRNPDHQPDEIEKQVLAELTEKNLDEKVKIEWENERIVYFRSVRLTKDCLACHGDPATSKELWGNSDGKDPTGATMEGWKEGEIHGAFELTYDLKKVIASNTMTRIIGILINLLIVIIAILLIRRIVRKALLPLDHMVLTLENINAGAGDLTVQIPVRNDDEVGKLSEQFNRFIGQLRDMVIHISDSASHVSASSEEMTASSQSLANIAQDQAASIEQTSSAMEEIKATIDSVSANAKNQAKMANTTQDSMAYLGNSIGTISQNAQNANRMAEETAAYALEGEKVLGSTVSSMHEISESSNKITEIVTIITDISDKINLLSLNASIEAARAGENGRGFAVVAEEIAKLADQTASSSGEINKLILETNKKVGSGSELVEQTAAALRKIIDNVKTTAQIMDDIAKSSVSLTNSSDTVRGEVAQVNTMSEEISVMMEEQSISSNEIIKAIDQINQITQQVASGSEEFAAASEELSSQAEVLTDIVRRFKL